MTGRAKKTAIVLFNLGGPDNPDAIRPFLFNLFNDKAIIGLPQPLRWLVARLISTRRAPVARDIYAHLGGGSPILHLTREQGRDLEQALTRRGIEAKTFIAMRYWHPFADETAAAIKSWGADEIVLLPLYPHYSTTTTQSSLLDWARAADHAGLALPSHTVCCYPLEHGFIAAHAGLLRAALSEAGRDARVLFSAHGLPKRVVAAGDPYQAQIEQTAAAIVAALDVPGLDWVTCYQSRVGPLEWIGPSTEAEIARAGADRKPLIVVPIAFVSEHSETLVELDIEYNKLAVESGVPAYTRVPALGTAPAFIETLAGLTLRALENDTILCPEEAAGYPCTAKALGLEVGS